MKTKIGSNTLKIEYLEKSEHSPLVEGVLNTP